MKDTFILNGQKTERKIINNHTDFFGNVIEGEFVKIAGAYAPLNEIKNNNLDNWLKTHLK